MLERCGQLVFVASRAQFTVLKVITERTLRLIPSSATKQIQTQRIRSRCRASRVEVRLGNSKNGYSRRIDGPTKWGGLERFISGTPLFTRVWCQPSPRVEGKQVKSTKHVTQR